MRWSVSKHVRIIGLMLLLAAAAYPLAAAQPGEDILGEEDITVVFAGMPTLGRLVLPANETEFRFKLTDTGHLVTIRWATLTEYERDRVMKLCGLQTGELNQKVYGERIKAIRYLLRTGRTLEGYPLPERDTPGARAMRTKASPFLVIAESDIVREDEFETFESQFFTPRELYERWLLEQPPGHDDAAAHLELARKCAATGLYQEALDHLASAAEIDPRTAERNQETRTQLLLDLTEKQAQNLFEELRGEIRRKEFFTALELLDRLDRNFPNSDLKSRWDALRLEVEQGTRTQLTRRVVELCYSVANDLLQQRLSKKTRIDEKGNLVPSIPGKQVATRQGHIFRGVLINPDASGDLVLKHNNMTITIMGKDILSQTDVDLSVAAREIPPAFDLLKEYVLDSGPDGLKGQMIARICQMTKQPKAKVLEIFNTRLEQSATYQSGTLTTTPIYATARNAAYGSGSWIREGSRPAPLTPAQTDAFTAWARGTGTGSGTSRSYAGGTGTGRNYAGGTGGRSYMGGTGGRSYVGATNRNPAGVTNNNIDDDPNLTNDPEVWWRYQSEDVKLDVLKGIMAEKVFTVKELTRIPCPLCAGSGYLQVRSTTGPSRADRCPGCRGIKHWFKLVYW